MKDLLSETPASILSHHADHDAVDSFIAWRKKIKKPLTDRAARMIAKTLAEINQGNGDATEALDMAQEHGWQTIKPDWYWRNKNGNGNTGRNGPGNSGHGNPGNGGGMAGSKVIQENADFAISWATRRQAGR